MSKILEDEIALKITRNLKYRRVQDYGFRLIGIGGILIAMCILFFVMGKLIWDGVDALYTTKIQLTINFDSEIIDVNGDKSAESLANGDYNALIKQSLLNLSDKQGELTKSQKKEIYQLVSPNASEKLQEFIIKNPQLLGTRHDFWLLASDTTDQVFGGKSEPSEIQQEFIAKLRAKKAIQSKFDTDFFTNGDSRQPESAGIAGGFIGSFFLMLTCFILAFPIGVMTAIFLEEFINRHKCKKWQLWCIDFLEITINSLASVPSIVFGLLGLGVYINFLGMPRSAPITGGAVLALMSLPVIIISARVSLRAIPATIREAVLALGANRVQLVFHHLIPLALPGICTGTIIALSRAIGETAPLLMIGMVAFILGNSSGFVAGFSEPSTALPVQIYLWANSSEAAFIERTSAAILVLILTMVSFNLLAIIIRQKFTNKW